VNITEGYQHENIEKDIQIGINPIKSFRILRKIGNPALAKTIRSLKVNAENEKAVINSVIIRVAQNLHCCLENTELQKTSFLASTACPGE